MKTDKLTKGILSAIAIALWIIAMNPWLHPVTVSAQDNSDISSIDSHVRQIATGTCTNSKIC
jgi:hypothetical protein